MENFINDCIEILNDSIENGDLKIANNSDEIVACEKSLKEHLDNKEYKKLALVSERLEILQKVFLF
jgi:hypothetical protein